MSIESTAFGVTTLSGGDAEKFLNQVTYGRPNQAAKDSVKNGRAMLKMLESKGSVQVKVKKRATI